jgi:uncharacterized cupin superfamily protein
VVLSGAPTLRTPEGTRSLAPGAVVAFRRGPEGAHRLSNRGDARARFLIVSTMHLPDVVEYPDTGGTLTITGPAAGKAYPGGADVPYRELVREAMDAASARERDDL